MTTSDPLLDRVAALRPSHLLDVGCGCGEFTRKLAEHCGQVTAVDNAHSIVRRAGEQQSGGIITYLCADARRLPFADRSIGLVVERGSLHHVREWESMLAEMLRVSSQRILALEPVDDPRSAGKRGAIAAHHLFLELQHEVGYQHYRHLSVEALRGWAGDHRVTAEITVIRLDRPVAFDEYFSPFELFAQKSLRCAYWLGRRDELRSELGASGLCADDLALLEISRERE